MSIILKGHTLNQRQLDAMLPVMNGLLQGNVSQKNFEDECVKALEAAGCPLGYDTTMPGAEQSIQDRAVAWLRDGRVGSSSRAIHDRMLGLNPTRYAHPHDPDDLNRCLMLLDLIPEWQERMPEMAGCSPEWSKLAASWDNIADAFLSEAGLEWSKRKAAPITYKLMNETLGKTGGPGWRIVR